MTVKRARDEISCTPRAEGSAGTMPTPQSPLQREALVGPMSDGGDDQLAKCAKAMSNAQGTTKGMIKARGDLEGVRKKTLQIVSSFEDYVEALCGDLDPDKGDYTPNDDETADALDEIRGKMRALVQSYMELRGWKAFAALTCIAECLDTDEDVCDTIKEWLDGGELEEDLGENMQAIANRMMFPMLEDMEDGGESVQSVFNMMMFPLEPSVKRVVDVEWLKERQEAVLRFAGAEGEAAVKRLVRAVVEDEETLKNIPIDNATLEKMAAVVA